MINRENIFFALFAQICFKTFIYKPKFWAQILQAFLFAQAVAHNLYIYQSYVACISNILCLTGAVIKQTNKQTNKQLTNNFNLGKTTQTETFALILVNSLQFYCTV